MHPEVLILSLPLFPSSVLSNQLISAYWETSCGLSLRRYLIPSVAWPLAFSRLLPPSLCYSLSFRKGENIWMKETGG